MQKEIVFYSDSEDLIEEFLGWWLDGGGEQDCPLCTEWNHIDRYKIQILADDES